MPLVGILLVGGINFQHFKIVLRTETKSSPEATLNIGSFMQNTINLLKVAISGFIAIKLVTSLYIKNDEAIKPPKKSADLLVPEEIRNLLKNNMFYYVKTFTHKKK